MTKKTRDLYEILEVTPRASQEVIDAAYRALLQRFHPDESQGDTAIIAEIASAFEILSDVKKRAKYDQGRKIGTDNVIGNYRILEEIAEGGFGITYKALNTVVEELVCIKHCSRIGPQAEQVLLDEAKTVWDLRHHGIPVMRDLIRMTDGSLALVMSYIPGPTLAQVVEKNGRLDPEHVCWIIERALNVLMYLHHSGVVHGDIKPQNIIIQPKTHRLTLIDFGLAMVRPSAKSANKGCTPIFASPEQLVGKTLLPESDFYSLALTMVFALAGDFDSVSKLHIPSSTPRPLVDFMKRLLAKDVLDRPNWTKEDLGDTMANLRVEIFGRRRSGMKPIPGVD